MGAVETILTLIAIPIAVAVAIIPLEIITRLYDLWLQGKRKT